MTPVDASLDSEQLVDHLVLRDELPEPHPKALGPLDYIAFDYVVRPAVYVGKGESRALVKPRRVVRQSGAGMVLKHRRKVLSMMTAQVDAGPGLGTVVAVLNGCRVIARQARLDGEA